MNVQLMFRHDSFPHRSSVVSVEEVSDVSSSSSSVEPIIVLPSFKSMELDIESSITHLMKAYGEAMEMEMTELADEIIIRLGEKGNPVTGSIIQRLAYYLNQALDKNLECSWKEATTSATVSFEIAFNAFYQILPLSRFPHFASNSVIMGSFPKDIADVSLHIVDFDFDRGVQWPPIIQELASQPKRVVKLTTIKWEETDEGEGRTGYYKNLLYEYARNLGVKLAIEEMGMEDLATNVKKRAGKEWLAFNCMVGLPHMGKRRCVSKVIEFLKIAKDSVASNYNKGTITFGDGIGWGKGLKGWVGDGSILEGQICQFEAFLEAIDTHLPKNLREARIAMECLFLVPYMWSLIDPKMWEDIAKESKALSELGLKAWRMREENLEEARELVKEGESYFWVEIEGVKRNQMVLGYKGTPLVKVSSWR